MRAVHGSTISGRHRNVAPTTAAVTQMVAAPALHVEPAKPDTLFRQRTTTSAVMSDG
jgi:hypothetical protein